MTDTIDINADDASAQADGQRRRNHNGGTSQSIHDNSQNGNKKVTSPTNGEAHEPEPHSQDDYHGGQYEQYDTTDRPTNGAADDGFEPEPEPTNPPFKWEDDKPAPVFTDTLDLGVLQWGKQGPFKHSHNVKLALRNTPCWAGAFAYDLLAHEIVTTRDTPAGKPGPIGDMQMSRILDWILEHGFNVQITTVEAGVFNYAIETAFHPVRDYLKSLVWDKKKRIDNWLTEYCGAEKSKYTQAVGAKFLISAVARALKPGCKVDTSLVLEGDQGTRKSTAVSILGHGEVEDGKDWFSDDLPTLDGKDARMTAAKFWLIELAELNALSKSETSAIKAFIARKAENYRPPYGRGINKVPRSCVFAGTVNPDGNGYLRDPTGGRRFWPVKVGTIKKDKLREDRDQLWAEATARFVAGGKAGQWWLNSEEEELAKDEQAARQEEEPWQEKVSEALKHFETTNVLDQDNKPLKDAAGENINLMKHGFTTQDVLARIVPDCARWNRADATRIGHALRRLGYFPEREGPRGDQRRVYRKKP